MAALIKAMRCFNHTGIYSNRLDEYSIELKDSFGIVKLPDQEIKLTINHEHYDH